MIRSFSKDGMPRGEPILKSSRPEARMLKCPSSKPRGFPDSRKRNLDIVEVSIEVSRQGIPGLGLAGRSRGGGLEGAGRARQGTAGALGREDAGGFLGAVGCVGVVLSGNRKTEFLENRPAKQRRTPEV